MGQIVGTKSNIFRCNLAAIQTGGSKANTILAADEVWLVDTTNSLTNSLSGNCDAYIVGNGSTAASALEIRFNKSEKNVFAEKTPVRLPNFQISNNTIISTSTQTLRYFHVNKGDVVKVIATASRSRTWRIGYSSEVPALNVSVQSVIELTATNIENVTVAPINGYIIFNHSKDYITSELMYVQRRLTDVELDNVPLNTTTDSLASITSLTAAFENVTGIDTGHKYILVDGTFSDTGTSSTAHVYRFEVNEGKYYKIVGRVRASTSTSTFAGFAFFNIYGEMLRSFEISTSEGRNFDSLIKTPNGTSYVVVSGSSDFVMPNVSEMVEASTAEQLDNVRKKLGIIGAELKTIKPLMSRDYLNIAGGIGHGNTVVDINTVIATARYIKVAGNVVVKSLYDRFMRVQKFDSDFSFIGYQDTSIVANVGLTLDVGNASYIKIMIAADNNYNVDISMQELEITGTFGDDWDVFNTRSSDDGYQRIAVVVNLTDPNCCDMETDNMQDFGGVGKDYGVVVLPETYQNIGEPSRLIIYCHGAAVNYSAGVTRFDSVDLEPDYWLAEGYAVMDIEGNPFNNTDEHFYIPEAMESYIAAYKWVIEHYNIRRDGVLLGGRSMGGGNTINLLRRECPIPVIAACPNVPVSTPTFCWNYMNADRRAFCAEHLGFENQPTWTSESPMPADQWQCLIDNFDKMVKYSPAWNIITELPSKDVLLASTMNISKNARSSEDEENLYYNLRATVKAPVKLFGCLDDTTCPVARTSMLYYKMFINSGQIVELRIFQEGGHHYDTQNPNLRTSVVTRYGVTLTDIPVVYIEMLKFWRRFEQ